MGWITTNDSDYDSRVKVNLSDVEIELSEAHASRLSEGIIDGVVDKAANRIASMVLDSDEWKDAHKKVYDRVIEKVRLSLLDDGRF